MLNLESAGTLARPRLGCASQPASLSRAAVQGSWLSLLLFRFFPPPPYSFWVNWSQELKEETKNLEKQLAFKVCYWSFFFFFFLLSFSVFCSNIPSAQTQRNPLPPPILSCDRSILQSCKLWEKAKIIEKRGEQSPRAAMPWERRRLAAGQWWDGDAEATQPCTRP